MSAQALRNQRVMSKAQQNFDARQHPDYYRKEEEDDTEEDQE